MTLGQLVVFAGLLQQFSTQITGMAAIVNTLEQSVTAARRVFEVLDAPLEVETPPDAAPRAAGGAARADPLRRRQLRLRAGRGWRWRRSI